MSNNKFVKKACYIFVSIEQDVHLFEPFCAF